MIVDDVELNLIILEEILKDDYDVIPCSSGFQAIDTLFSAKTLPKIILLDIMMPDMDGYEVLSIIKANEIFTRIPVMFITAADSETTALAAGAVDYVSKPFQPDIVKLRVANHIKLKNYSDNLESLVAEKIAELMATRDKMLDALANIIEYRNLESGSHVKRTRSLSAALMERLVNHSPYERELLAQKPEIIMKSVALHDIGKIAIPDAILLKRGKLDSEEFEVIKTHTTLGKGIIESMLDDKDSIYLKHCCDICYSHHERFDGLGYPQGLKGDEIPLSARILSIVDVYDALVCERVYKPAIPHEKTIEIIREGYGTQFDPVVVQALLDIQDVFLHIHESEP